MRYILTFLAGVFATIAAVLWLAEQEYRRACEIRCDLYGRR